MLNPQGRLIPSRHVRTPSTGNVPPQDPAGPVLERIAQAVERPPGDVCLSDACMSRLIDRMRAMLESNRGANVRAPSTCQQPTNSQDVDRFLTGVVIAAGAAVGTVATVATFSCGGLQAVLKGMGWTASVLPPSVTDPFSIVRFRLLLNGAPLAPYDGMPFGASLGLAGLTAIQVLMKSGDVATLQAEKYAAVAEQVTCAGRLKGWSYTPTQDRDGVLGTIAW